MASDSPQNLEGKKDIYGSNGPQNFGPLQIMTRQLTNYAGNPMPKMEEQLSIPESNLKI